MYQNEQEVGEALKATDIPREELWITSKLNNGFHRPDDARRAFDETLAKLGLEQLDLFLIHWPLPDALRRRLRLDLADPHRVRRGRPGRSIGVSNFQPAHLDRIVAETGVVPAVNQIEAHPYFTNEAAREASHRHGVLVEAWSPIAQGAVLDDEVIGKIAAAHGRTPSQVTLRWHIERGDIVFPKTTHRERMEENFAIFDFELSAGRGRRDQRPRPGRGRPHAAPTRTPSTRSRTDQAGERGQRTFTRTSLEASGPSVSRTRNLLTPAWAVWT